MSAPLLERTKAIVHWEHPDFHSKTLTHDELLSLIAALVPVVEDFSLACSLCAAQKNRSALGSLHKSFADLALLCHPSEAEIASRCSTAADAVRFIGHEMFVTWVAAMIRHQCWDALATAYWLDEWGPLPRQHLPLVQTKGFSPSTSLLDPHRQLHRLSVMLRTDLLVERHGPGGPLVRACPLEEFRAADIFLLLRHAAKSPPEGPADLPWVPWSCALADEMPLLLIRAMSRQQAQIFADALGLTDTEQLKQTLKLAARRLAKFLDTASDDGPVLACKMARAVRLVPEWSQDALE